MPEIGIPSMFKRRCLNLAAGAALVAPLVLTLFVQLALALALARVLELELAATDALGGL